MLGLATGKFNNTQTLLDEFYKTTMYPMIINIEQKFRMGLLKGYPNLCIEFDVQDFLKGAPLDQMNYVVAGVNAGNINVGITGDNEIDTDSGNLTIDSAGGTVTVDDNLIVTGDLTVSGTTTTINSTRFCSNRKPSWR